MTKKPKIKNAVSKTRYIGPKGGIGYYVVAEDGSWTSCHPRSWHSIDIPDDTSPAELARVAEIRYMKERKQFNLQVTDNQYVREQMKLGNMNKNNKYIMLCQKLGICF